MYLKKKYVLLSSFCYLKNSIELLTNWSLKFGVIQSVFLAMLTHNWLQNKECLKPFDVRVVVLHQHFKELICF